MRVRLKTGIVLILLASSCSACGGRIKKLPVDNANKVRSHRLALQGDRLLRDGKDHLALLKYIDASTLDPYSEVVFNKLAIAYSRLLQFEQAKRAIDRSIRLNPDYAYGHNTRGIIQLALRDSGGAVKSFHKAIRLMPGKASFHVNLGNAHLQRGEFGQGRESFLRALTLDANVFQNEDAIQVASLRGPPNPEDYYRMARLFAELGDDDTALEYLRKALVGGFRDGERLRSDAVFDSLRENPKFQSLASSFGLQI